METFERYTVPDRVEKSLQQLAEYRADKFPDSTEEIELAVLREEHSALGEFIPFYGKATSEGTRQLYDRVRMTKCYSLNFICDEIGSNYGKIGDVIADYLQLFDGVMESKVIKNTKEQQRSKHLTGTAPANLLLFGSPELLLDGALTEKSFRGDCSTGIARRSLFAFGKGNKRNLTPKERFELTQDKSIPKDSLHIMEHMRKLGEPGNYGRIVSMREDTLMKYLEYEYYCQERANALLKHESDHKFEIQGRPQKAKRLLAVYAFIDQTSEATVAQLENAIRLVEDSGEAYLRILNQPPAHERLAHYLAGSKKAKTNPEIMADLKFYAVNGGKQKELMDHAKAYGYSQGNIIIETFVNNGVFFHKGNELQETTLANPIMAKSSHQTFNYSPVKAVRVINRGKPNETKEKYPVKFTQLHKVLCGKKLNHWTAHHWVDSPKGKGHRNKEYVKLGFNLLVLDIDGGVPVDYVRGVLQDYTYFIHTTRKSTARNPRMRVVLPLKHRYELDPETYKEFMSNVYSELPFNQDEQTKNITRKWLTAPLCGFTKEEVEQEATEPANPVSTQYWYNKTSEDEFSPMDGLKYIPNTFKNDERIKENQQIKDLNGLEHWVLKNSMTDGRNNSLIRYALVLADRGETRQGIEMAVKALNGKLENPLPDSELYSTILSSATVLDKLK